MGIVTKKGDKGKTSLYFGGMVSKDHPRVELCGALDELSSFLGVAKSLLKDKQSRAWIEAVQKDIVMIAAEVATAPGFLPSSKNVFRKRTPDGLSVKSRFWNPDPKRKISVSLSRAPALSPVAWMWRARLRAARNAGPSVF